MRFEAITFDSLSRSLEVEFKYRGDHEATKAALIAEHIRGVVDSMSLMDAGGEPAEVSPQKLGREVRRRTEPLFGNSNQADQVFSFSDEVDAMVRLGEIWRSTTGGYVTAPPRILTIDDEVSLLIGGGATRLLPNHVRRNITQAGRARIFNKSSGFDSSLDSVPEQTLQSWLGLTHECVTSWASEYIDSINCAKPFDDEAENLLVLSERGWIPLAKSGGAYGYRLARRPISFYGNPSFQYYVCTIKTDVDDLATVESLAKIDKQDARRLQPLLIGGAGTRPTLQCDVSGERCKVTLFWPLAEPESKLLCLGWKLPNSENTALWPRTYCFSSRLQPFLASALEILGYNVTLRTN